jgi:hypothetical protein
MNPPQPFITAKPRVQRKRRESAASAPVVLHQIVSVEHGGNDQECSVTVSEPIASADLPAMETSWDGVTWYAATSVDVEDETTLRLMFAEDVGNFWRVTEPSDWHFADGGNLDAPYSGSLRTTKDDKVKR